MNKIISLALFTLAAFAAPLARADYVSQAVHNDGDLYEEQVNMTNNGVVQLFEGHSLVVDEIRFTDGSNGGWPSTAYLGDGLYIDHTANVLKLDWTMVAQAPEKLSVQTDTSGNYTWTFPIAFGAGVVPNVQASAYASGSTDSYNVTVTAKSNTAMTIHVTRTTPTAIALLGLTIGVTSSSPQCYVDLVAQNP